MRLNNLEFGECTYLCKPPERKGWEIRKWYPNEYYGRESDFIKDGEYYHPNNYSFINIHESCFKNPESCYQLASWNWNGQEYKFSFCGDRPIDLNDLEWEIFRQLIKYGFDYLNHGL